MQETSFVHCCASPLARGCIPSMENTKFIPDSGLGCFLTLKSIIQLFLNAGCGMAYGWWTGPCMRERKHSPKYKM